MAVAARKCLSVLVSAFLPGFLPHSAAAETTLKLGTEGFYDHYTEPDSFVDVDEKSYYGSGTASLSASYGGYYGALEGRGSYGRSNYKSPSGLLKHIPEYETEGRLLGGVTLPLQDGQTVVTYIGFGTRYYFEKNKGNVSSLGLFAYDRRILQLYLPIGVSMKFTSGDWNYSPLLEFDPLLHGWVKSRLSNIPGFYNINNPQHKGYGWRGEFMVGQQYKYFGWETGPFFRYWNITASDVATDPNGVQWIEPHNNRLQAGAQLRVTF